MLRLRIAAIDPLAAVADDAWPTWMGASERLRWTTLAVDRRREFLAARRLLRDVLAQATGRSGDRWQVSAEPGVAPVARLAGGVAGTAPDVSLAHRLGWVAAASFEGPVGVDVECARPARSDPVGRAALMLSPSELAAWHALPTDERESALLTGWTAKEAWFKANPPGAAPWDFRRIVARACAPAQANVRAWAAAPLHVAVCCADAGELQRVACEGIDPAVATSTFWRVSRT